MKPFKKDRDQESEGFHFFSHRFKSRYKDFAIEVCANLSLLMINVEGIQNVGVFSMGRKDRIFALRLTPFRISKIPEIPVFAVAGHLSQQSSTFLSSESFVESFIKLQLKSEESLHVNSTAVKIYLRNRTELEVVDRLNILCSVFSGSRSLESTKQRDWAVLPITLTALIPLIEKWGLSDDLKREELIQSADELQLAQLVDNVSPFMPEINDYLNSFTNRPMPGEACALDSLAQAVEESRLYLQEK